MSDIQSIQPAGGSGGIEPGRTGKPDKSSEGPSFSDVLDKTKKVDNAGQVDGTSRLASPHPPAYIGPVDKAEGIQETVQRSSEEFFRLFDKFQNDLGNSQSSMKDIAPLILDMERYRTQVANDIKSLPEGDPGRSILEEMAVMVTAETAKFNRGEYI